MSSRGIIGPFWFEDDEGRTETINAQRYRSDMSRFWSALKIKQRGDVRLIERQWIQQDGAAAHTATATRDWLRARFEERLISRLGSEPMARALS